MKKIFSLIIVLGLLLLNFPSIAEAITYTFTPPIDVPGASGTWADGINDSNNIVGQYQDATGWHGFLDVGGNFTPINVPGAYYTAALGINDSNNIVGTYWDATGGHGFLDVGGNFTPINAGAYWTEAHGINDSNNIVGLYSDGTETHGFLDVGGNFTPINVPGASYTAALGINDSNNIVGQYQYATGWRHGFVATPIPEPSTVHLLGSGLLGLAGYGRRKFFKK